MHSTSKPDDARQSYDPDQENAVRIQQLKAAGLRCVPVRADAPKQLAYADKPCKPYTLEQFRGRRIGIRTGKLADGTYLCRIDIDQHLDHQDAEAAFARLLPFIESAPELFAVRRSTNGLGYDVLFRSPRELPNNQPFTIDGRDAGEIFCEGGWVGDSNWSHGAPERLVPLDDDQLEHLLAVVKLRGVNAKPHGSQSLAHARCSGTPSAPTPSR